MLERPGGELYFPVLTNDDDDNETIFCVYPRNWEAWLSRNLISPWYTLYKMSFEIAQKVSLKGLHLCIIVHEIHKAWTVKLMMKGKVTNVNYKSSK